MPRKLFPPPAEDQKRDVFRNSMYYEILYTFGVPHDYDPSDYFQWEVVNYSRMAHARLLDKFFETEPGKRSQDDVLAADFGFSPRPILTKDERDRLNKDLLHFSYGRLRHTLATKKWPSSILGSLLAPTLEFMELVQTQRKLFATDGEFNAWIALIDFLKSGHELLVRSVGDEGSARYTIVRGRPLPDGKPALTEWRPVERDRKVQDSHPTSSIPNTTVTMSTMLVCSPRGKSTV